MSAIESRPEANHTQSLDAAATELGKALRRTVEAGSANVDFAVESVLKGHKDAGELAEEIKAKRELLASQSVEFRKYLPHRLPSFPHMADLLTQPSVMQARLLAQHIWQRRSKFIGNEGYYLKMGSAVLPDRPKLEAALFMPLAKQPLLGWDRLRAGEVEPPCLYTLARGGIDVAETATNEGIKQQLTDDQVKSMVVYGVEGMVVQPELQAPGIGVVKLLPYKGSRIVQKFERNLPRAKRVNKIVAKGLPTHSVHGEEWYMSAAAPRLEIGLHTRALALLLEAAGVEGIKPEPLIEIAEDMDRNLKELHELLF